jgi:DNA polymerase I
MNPEKNLLCLVDASSFIFRAFYAVRPLSNKAGLPTNAVFGFVSMLVKILTDLRPTHMVVLYDTKHPSFRKEIYPEYKANRGAMPEELVPQIPYVKKVVEAMGLKGLEREGFEADDLIASLAVQSASMLGSESAVCIVSSDKDLMQLVNERIYLYDTMKEIRYSPAAVKEKLGVPPNLVADYLGLIGDSSDNIPGVAGVGPKGAVALLEQFGSLEGIFEDLSQVKREGQRKQLSDGKESALLSKRLATVKSDITVDLSEPEIRCLPNMGGALQAVLLELDFHTLAKRLSDPALFSHREEPATKNEEHLDSISVARADVPTVVPHRILRTGKELEDYLVGAAEIVALDTETDSLKAHDRALVALSFFDGTGEAVYVPCGHRNQENRLLQDQVPMDDLLKVLQRYLPQKKWVGQNLKFDWNVLRGMGCEMDRAVIAFDTMVASYVLDSSERHGLDFLASKYLGFRTIEYKELCGEGKGAIPFSRVPLEKAAAYGAQDALIAFRLYQEFKNSLANERLEFVFEKIDLPLVPVLASMEWEGVAIDTPHLQRLQLAFAEDILALEKRAWEVAEEEFNLASPKQLAKILFEKLGLTSVKKTKTGQSTDVEVLEKLQHVHPLPKIILEHRELSKLKGTYVDVLPLLVHPASGRVHASFHQTVTATGRLSSSDPNLQNIPVRTSSGQLVRKAFVAKRGWKLIGADYSQIELRILASMSGDPSLTRAFTEGRDVHSITAAEVFQVELSEVNPDLRRQAKAINFGLLYGKTAFSLAEELGVSRGRAAEIIQRYFARYPTIREFLDKLVEQAKERGYAETLFGRRRALEEIRSKNRAVAAGAERMAVNTPIQGTAADLIKFAMNDLYLSLKNSDLQSKLVMQVHDELVVEAPLEELDRAKELIRTSMESAGRGRFSVPLTVEIAVGDNWWEMS